jgi:hypothetical protein
MYPAIIAERKKETHGKEKKGSQEGSQEAPPLRRSSTPFRGCFVFSAPSVS